MSTPRTLHLNVNALNLGKHDAAWRLHDAPDRFLDIDHYVEIARIAERGTFDAVFLADGPGLAKDFDKKPWNALEPTVLLSALAMATERVGLIATASTTYNDPYNLSRRLASLDHVSRGRVGWNVVTTQGATGAAIAANFGAEPFPTSAVRYARAEEFVDVAARLWSSWEPGALRGDAERAEFVDGSRVHEIDHVGTYFSVRGPLNVPSSPQGRPVLVQAGGSAYGKALAARTADMVFTAQTTFHDAQAYYADLKASARAFGRDPEHVLVLPGLLPIIGSTEREALARKEQLDALLDVDSQLEQLSITLGIPKDEIDLDGGVPSASATTTRLGDGMLHALQDLVRRDGLTLRQALGRMHAGHRLVVGTPEQIADDIEHWFEGGAADGFNVYADSFPTGFESFVDHVIPELRRRGLFRHEYAETTLRGHLGLHSPAPLPSASSALSPQGLGA